MNKEEMIIKESEEHIKRLKTVIKDHANDYVLPGHISPSIMATQLIKNLEEITAVAKKNVTVSSICFNIDCISGSEIVAQLPRVLQELQVSQTTIVIDGCTYKIANILSTASIDEFFIHKVKLILNKEVQA